MNFGKVKRDALSKLDLSKKGSIDSRIESLVADINESDKFYTTSSCSGRIIVVSKPSFDQKKACNWLYTSHEPVDSSYEIISRLEDHKDDASLLFEPFILHVRCDSLQSAKCLLLTAIESGFRNSGITVGKNDRCTVAVRSTHSLQVPLSSNGNVLVTREYMDYVIKLANEQLTANFSRIEKFYLNVKKVL